MALLRPKSLRCSRGKIMRLRALKAVPLLFVAACGLLTDAETPDVSLFADQEAVAPGEAVSLTLVNRSRYEFVYSLCDSRLTRRSEDGWHPAGRAHPCLGIGYVLAPHSEAHVDRWIDTDLPSGDYRLTARLQPARSTATIAVTSNVFAVR
jgi:hypothetical protein